MKNRRGFVLTLVAGVVALAVIITPVIAEELLGVITKIDVAGKKVTVVEKGSDKEVVVTTTDDTEIARGDQKFGLEQLQKGLTKQLDAGKKGIPAKVTHKDGVASKITIPAKKAAN